jgi:hypothetical protein
VWPAERRLARRHGTDCRIAIAKTPHFDHTSALYPIEAAAQSRNPQLTRFSPEIRNYPFFFRQSIHLCTRPEQL